MKQNKCIKCGKNIGVNYYFEPSDKPSVRIVCDECWTKVSYRSKNEFNIMKLYICFANNGINGVIVATSEDEAEEKFIQLLQNAGYYEEKVWAHEIKVDGYEIILRKI